MIGSHNSGTYIIPNKWYTKLFSIFARCQNKTIEEQFLSGVRVFDFRIRMTDYDNNIKLINNTKICHGLCEYGDKNTLNDILRFLNEKSKEENVYVILVYEKNIFKEKYSNLYPKLVDEIKKDFPNIDFQFIFDKKKWKLIEDFKKRTWMVENVYYWKLSLNTFLPLPCLYNRKNIMFNTNIISSDKILLWRDFI